MTTKSTQNHPPQAKITILSGRKKTIGPNTIKVSGEKSTDPDKDSLHYFWQFDQTYNFIGKNPPPYTFKNIGNHEIKLTVTDSFNLSSTTSLALMVEKTKTTDSKETDLPDDFAVDDNPSVIFNELFPNPEGQDRGNEWIELKNLSNEKINLKSWQLLTITSNNKLKSFPLPPKVILPNEYLVLTSQDISFSLHNEALTLRLLNNKKKFTDEVSYVKSTEGYSYARINLIGKNSLFEIKKWEWNAEPTKGTENQIYEILTGIVNKSAADSFYLQTDQQQNQIFISSLPPEIASTIFTKKTSLHLLAQKINSNEYLLKDYQIIDQPKITNSFFHDKSTLISLIITIFLIILIISGQKIIKTFKKSL